MRVRIAVCLIALVVVTVGAYQLLPDTCASLTRQRQASERQRALYHAEYNRAPPPAPIRVYLLGAGAALHFSQAAAQQQDAIAAEMRDRRCN